MLSKLKTNVYSFVSNDVLDVLLTMSSFVRCAQVKNVDMHQAHYRSGAFLHYERGKRIVCQITNAVSVLLVFIFCVRLELSAGCVVTGVILNAEFLSERRRRYNAVASSPPPLNQDCFLLA